MRLSFLLYFKRIVALVTIVSVFLFSALPVSAFSTNPAYVVGWAWNSVMGWVKMRGDIVSSEPSTIGQRSGTYGVTVTKDGSSNDGIVSGWSWSSNYGWICWGETCDPATFGSGGGTGTNASATLVDAGLYSSCVLATDATVKCWGYNASGQLGDGTTTNSLTPVTVTGLTGVTQIAVGSNFGCALVTGGDVWCWGYNSYGQLGNNSTTQSNVPVKVQGLLGSVTAITAGLSHTCALLSDKRVECWGYGNATGDGTGIDRRTPVLVSGISNASSIDAGSGGSHTCAKLSDNTMKCWGNNFNGQMGNGTSGGNTLTPVVVTGLPASVANIGVGSFHSCATLSDGSAWCWGNGGSGQLGNGSASHSSVPVKVTGVSTASSISGGGYHSCVRLSDATVKCWGSGTYGQLGNGSTSQSNTPVNVSIAGVASLASGSYTSCALLTNGAVNCWGINGQGQLGDGTTTNRSTPVVSGGFNGTSSSGSGGNNYGNAVPSGGWKARIIDLYNPLHSSPSATVYTVQGWAKILVLKDDGWISLSGSAGTETYGVVFNSDIREFRGWAWNGVDNGFSVGWIAFSGETVFSSLDCDPSHTVASGWGGPTYYAGAAECIVSYAADQSIWATQIIDKWLETKGGNIYSQKGFNASPEPPTINNKFNSDYLIHSATQVDNTWRAACTSSTATGTDLPACNTITNPDEAFDNMELPTKDNSYKTSMGLINTDALTDTVLVDGVRNKYGYRVVTLDANGSQLLSVMNGSPLNNRVFFRDGDLTIDYSDPDSDPEIRRFANATISGESGAGTIVVRGNINFKDSLIYESASNVDSVKKLASVAWIALKRSDNSGGNITIDNCMDPAPRGSSEPAMLVGTFFAEGIVQTGSGVGGTSAGECSNLKVVTTTTDTSVTPATTTTSTEYVNVPLHVKGVMIASQFTFQRKQVDYERGSELIDYDGRLTVNTPPGLDDFAKQLPVWRATGF